MTSNAPSNALSQPGQELLRRLTSRPSATFDAALLDAVSDTSHGEQTLLQALPLVTKTRLPHVLAALGDLGDLGNSGRSGHADAIRQAGRRGGQDARTTSLVALTKREGARATPDLLEALASRDAVVKDHALRCLVVAGDDRAWEAVHHRFACVVRRPPGKVADSWVPGENGQDLEDLEDLAGRIRLYAPADLAALVYLISHANPARGQVLVRQLQQNWTTLATHRPLLARWLQRRWPHLLPDPTTAEPIALPDVNEELRWYRQDPTFAAAAITPDIFGAPPAPPTPSPAERQRVDARTLLVQAQQQAACTSTSADVLRRLISTGRTQRIRSTAQQRLETLPQ